MARRTILITTLAIMMFMATAARAETRIDGTTINQLAQVIREKMSTFSQQTKELNAEIQEIKEEVSRLKMRAETAASKEDRLVMEAGVLKMRAQLMNRFTTLLQFKVRQISQITPNLDKLEAQLQASANTQPSRILSDPATRREINDLVATTAFLAKLGSKKNQKNVEGLLASYDKFLNVSRQNLLPVDKWSKSLRRMRSNLNIHYTKAQLGLKNLANARNQMLAQARLVKVGMIVRDVHEEMNNFPDVLDPELTATPDIEMDSFIPDPFENETVAVDYPATPSPKLETFAEQGLTSLQ